MRFESVLRYRYNKAWTWAASPHLVHVLVFPPINTYAYEPGLSPPMVTELFGGTLSSPFNRFWPPHSEAVFFMSKKQAQSRLFSKTQIQAGLWSFGFASAAIDIYVIQLSWSVEIVCCRRWPSEGRVPMPWLSVIQYKNIVYLAFAATVAVLFRAWTGSGVENRIEYPAGAGVRMGSGDWSPAAGGKKLRQEK